MELLKYIFILGIIFMIFSMIWGFFMILYRALTGFGQRPAIESYVFKLLNMYFLVSLSAMQTIAYYQKPGAPKMIISITGILVLYSYLMGRLERSRFVMQFNNNQITTPPRINTAWESFIVISSLIYFSYAITRPTIVENAANRWFYEAVMDIYHTPVIGWLFMAVGFLFLIVNVVKSIFVTSKLIAWIIEKITGQSNDNDDNGNFNSGSKDGFSDYEIIEDDKLDER